MKCLNSEPTEPWLPPQDAGFTPTWKEEGTFLDFRGCWGGIWALPITLCPPHFLSLVPNGLWRGLMGLGAAWGSGRWNWMGFKAPSAQTIPWFPDLIIHNFPRGAAHELSSLLPEIPLTSLCSFLEKHLIYSLQRQHFPSPFPRVCCLCVYCFPQ